MADTKKLFRLFDSAGKAASLYSEDVFDKTSGKTLAEYMAAAPTDADIQGLIDTAIEAVKSGDIAGLQSSLSSLSATVNNFLTGDPDDNGSLDRLKELVAAIEANKGSIDALVRDHATKEELTSLVERVSAIEPKAHEHANKDVLDGIGKEDGSGNLTFNGKELTGETGIAFGASIDEATVYTGKLRIVVEDYAASGV